MCQRIISVITIISLLSSFALNWHVKPVQAGLVSTQGASESNANHQLRLTKTPNSVVLLLPYESTALLCQAVGSPPPTIHWLKDGQRLLQGSVDSVQTNLIDDGNIDTSPLDGASQSQSKLYIDCLTPEDEGTYTCVAETPFSRVSSDTVVAMSKEGVVVKEPLCFKETLIGLPARIYMWTRFRFERQGNDVQLFCRSSELPESYVTWSRGEENAQLENGEKYMILNNGDLIIRDISWEDMGIYTCNARNAFGSDTALAFLYPVKI